ncbi:MAG: hypothetical protein WCG25_09600 [bacterium]
MKDSKDMVVEINTTNKPKEEAKVNSTWTSEDITQQLQAYNLEASELSDITKMILQKKKDLDYGESGKIYFIIKEGKINIYAKIDYTKKIEEVKKQLRLNKIEEIKKALPSENNLVEYPDGKF